MCGILKKLMPSAPEPQPLPETPSKAEAATEAREQARKVSASVAKQGKQSTILAGGDLASDQLKKRLGE